ncbi:MAG: hypothetical protein JNK82_31120 [Myxococcaceae bacterium]|nr:hypothetical protein [Myxococcaceae bacterium]
MNDGECYSCGLWLDDVMVCPGCGAVQTVDDAKVPAARCVEHEKRVAVFTCGRCGRYGCAQCEHEDSGSCWSCVPSRAQVLVRELKRVRKQMAVSVFAFAGLSPLVALAAQQVQLAVVLAVLSGCMTTLTVNAWVHRDFSAFALSLMGIACILLVCLLGASLLPLVPLGVAGWLFTRVNRCSALEIEHWRFSRVAAEVERRIAP